MTLAIFPNFPHGVNWEKPCRFANSKQFKCGYTLELCLLGLHPKPAHFGPTCPEVSELRSVGCGMG